MDFSVVHLNQVIETDLKATTGAQHEEAGLGCEPHRGCLILYNTDNRESNDGVPGTRAYRVIRYRALTFVVHLPSIQLMMDGTRVESRVACV